MAKSYPGKSNVKFTTGMVKNAGGENIETLQEAMTSSSSCGCGPDCCKNVYHWLDQTSGERYVTYINGGELVVQLYSEFVADGPVVNEPVV